MYIMGIGLAILNRMISQNSILCVKTLFSCLKLAMKPDSAWLVTSEGHYQGLSERVRII